MSENPFFSNEEAAHRGREATRMLESPVFRDALGDAKRRFVAEWLGTPNIDVQKACWSKIHALDEVEKALQRIIADGQYAEAAINQAQG